MFVEMFETDNGEVAMWGGPGGEWTGVERMPAGSGFDVLLGAADDEIPSRLTQRESTLDERGALVAPGRTIAVVDAGVFEVFPDRFGEAGRRLFGVTAD